jgi:hypothetical protein
MSKLELLDSSVVQFLALLIVAMLLDVKPEVSRPKVFFYSTSNLRHIALSPGMVRSVSANLSNGRQRDRSAMRKFVELIGI